MNMSREKRQTFLKLAAFVALVVVSVVFVFATRGRSQFGGARVISLRAGDDLQAALRNARFGDTIILPAGSTFVGPIVLPFKGASAGGDADYITIRTSDLGGIAAEGERIKPALHARAMAKIVAPREKSAVVTESRANHYRFVGIEFAPAADAGYVFNVVDLGSGDYATPGLFPHHLIFDRCYVHSTGLNRARRGFALNSAETSVINSHVSGFAGAADETQAIAAWNSPGPLHIVNNYLEGAGEVVLIGGADPAVPNLVPSDIEIRRNFMRKPKEWLGRATVKGTFELKNARRVVIEGNLIESEILTTAIVLTVRNQGGKAPWSTLEDVDIRNNIVRHANTGVNILGSDNEHHSQEAKRIRITNNLFVDLIVADPENIPYFLQTNGGRDISVSHNTVQQAGNVITGYGAPVSNFVFRDNIVQFNRYGIVCQIEAQECGSAFCGCYPAGVFRGNVFVDNLSAAASDNVESRYPAGNYFVSSYQKAGIADFAHGNWRLEAPSGTPRKASDGRNPGVDFEALVAAGAIAAREGTSLKNYVR
jgi:hypothetical protein